MIGHAELDSLQGGHANGVLWTRTVRALELCPRASRIHLVLQSVLGGFFVSLVVLCTRAPRELAGNLSASHT